MSHFDPAPSETPTKRVGVLLANLGTPDTATPQAVRRYLGEFLADPRVVELPRLLWWPILHGLILPLRAAKSARKYATVWMREGSPLAVHSERQAKLLKGYLAEAGIRKIEVLHGMRYGSPSITKQLKALAAAGCDRILILPLYPQYSGSTTGAVADALAGWMRRTRSLPELRMARSFPTHPGYLHALAESVREHWRVNGRAEKLVISFHGLPCAVIEKGDPYLNECRQSALALARALALDEKDWVLSFQSRFGRSQWLTPSTQQSLIELAKSGVDSVDVLCPGFVSDCLETLEEIALEGKRDFLGAGGKDFRPIACLNERADFIRALQTIVKTQAGDWLEAENSQANPVSGGHA